MKLIHFEGLNCYYNSIITIADAYHVDYTPAFSNLWSESIFLYDPFRTIFVSERLIDNLASLGVVLEELPCKSAQETEDSLTKVENGAYLVIGMNAFHVPWSPHSGIFHGPHYFIIKYHTPDKILCYDPTHKLQDMPVSYEFITTHTNDMAYLHLSASSELPLDDFDELKRIISEHPTNQTQLISWFKRCHQDNRAEATMAAKYVDSMIHNRYLYRHYLKSQNSPLLLDNPMKEDSFFEKWIAVKNGLFKASLFPDNESVIEEVCALVTDLLDQELTAAQTIFQLYN